MHLRFRRDLAKFEDLWLEREPDAPAAGGQGSLVPAAQTTPSPAPSSPLGDAEWSLDRYDNH